METPGRTQNDGKRESRGNALRSRVAWFKRADGWFNRFVRLAAAVHEGFWLGWLSVDDLNAVTADHYNHSRESPSAEHNLRGFLSWEAAAVERHFAPGSRVLVAAAGGGREVLALRLAGYRAEGFECNPALVEASAATFEGAGESRGVTLCPPDQVPEGPAEYGGIIVGWSAYTHIPTRRRRVAFLKALRQRAATGSPILLSFFAQKEISRYDTLVCRVAGMTRVLLRGRGEPVEVGDHLTWSYNHLFTREEVEAELREAGIRMVDYGEVGDGHAVGIVE